MRAVVNAAGRLSVLFAVSLFAAGCEAPCAVTLDCEDYAPYATTTSASGTGGTGTGGTGTGGTGTGGALGGGGAGGAPSGGGGSGG